MVDIIVDHLGKEIVITSTTVESCKHQQLQNKAYLNVNNGVRTRVLLNVLENTDTTKIVSASDHDEVSNTELNAILNLLSLEVELDGIVFFNIRVRITDGAAIMGRDEWDSLRTQLDTLNLAELVLSLLGGDLVQSELALDVVQKTEVLVGAVNGDNILIC